MESTQYFEVVCLMHGSIASIILEDYSAKNAKHRVEQHWREHQMYEHHVIKVVPSTYSDFLAQHYNV